MRSLIFEVHIQYIFLQYRHRQNFHKCLQTRFNFDDITFILQANVYRESISGNLTEDSVIVQFLMPSGIHLKQVTSYCIPEQGSKGIRQWSIN